jgi:hypothetical protein
MPAPRPRRRAGASSGGVTGPVRGIHLPALSPDGGTMAFVALNAL